MPQHTVFIGYSRKDEKEKEALLSHLGVLECAGLIDLWGEDRLGAGTDWEQEISQAITQARVAILLISANFLTSAFILNRVIPALLKRYEDESLPVFPIIAKACAWEKVGWLQKMSVRPKSGKPVWSDGGHHVDEDLAIVAREVATIVQEPDHTQPMDIPVVVAAMTRHEANELVTGTVFDNPEVAPIEHTRFQEFRKALRDHRIDDLLPYYAESRDDWRPPSGQGSTIKQIILNIVERVNQECSETLGPSKIRPRFISEDFFSSDDATRLHIWQSHDWGSIIVADSISLFHPRLHKTLANSEMSSKEQVAVLILSPVNFSKISVNQLIEEKITERAFTRFNRNLDKLCEFGAGDLRTLQRWLFVILPEVANRLQKPRLYPANREVMRKMMGKKPHGMGPFIY